MESSMKKIMSHLKTNWYVILILVIGVILLLMPTNAAQQNQPAEETQPQMDLQQELEDILSCIQGVGQVQVLLTVAAGERFVYQMDENGTSFDTVIITDENRNESGLVCQVIPPSYRGAIVVCQGADRPQVQLQIVDAVRKVTGLGADQIIVLKMK